LPDDSRLTLSAGIAPTGLPRTNHFGFELANAHGAISHSGGIQGACSWHGGVAGGG
jgi:hypothetical protein